MSRRALGRKEKFSTASDIYRERRRQHYRRVGALRHVTKNSETPYDCLKA